VNDGVDTELDGTGPDGGTELAGMGPDGTEPGGGTELAGGGGVNR
jgi:hypothetical protein